MKIFLILAITIGFGWFFFIFEGKYESYSSLGITLEDEKFIEDLMIEKEKIVEDKKLINVALKYSKKLIEESKQRNKICHENANAFFSQSKNQLLKKESVLENLDYVFKNTLERKNTEKLFKKVIDVMYSGVTFNQKRFKRYRKNIETCRPKESLNFIDRIIDRIPNYPLNLKKKITYRLSKNINEILLGHFWTYKNLDLVLGYLVKMEEKKLIKTGGALKKRKYSFEIFHANCDYSIDQAQEANELDKVYKGCIDQQKRFSENLKNALGNFGG